MKAVVNCKNVDIMRIVPQTSDDGEISWNSCVFMQGMKTNTLTIDKSIDTKIRGEGFELVIDISEEAKSTRKGGAYVGERMKIIDVLKDGKSFKAVK